MKRYTFVIILFTIAANTLHAQVKIGGAAEIPHASAVLELDGGNNRGLLLPRMRKMDIDAIQNPAEGLTIYATDEQAVYTRKSLVWEKQGPFSLPYFGEYSASSVAGIYITNNFNAYNATAIRGNADAGNGVMGTSKSGDAVIGIASGQFAVGGRFENRNGGSGIVCEGIIDILDENGSMIRFFDPTRYAKSFIQQVNNDLKVGTLATNDPGRVILRTNGSDRLWVDSTGYVTIGGRIGPTISGPYKLAVKGKIAATDFNVVATGSWPDYVFDPSYKLRSLEETEAYIKENKHLPNIPAAAVVEKEGFALGDMQKKMLEKIEELTLHLIEANKALKEFRSSSTLEIEQLKQQVQALQPKK